MVDAIKLLRQQAATKRNQAIQQARAEYGHATKLIDELASCLTPQFSRRRQQFRKRVSILDLIIDVLPKQEPFTIVDILELLRGADPGRRFQEATVRTMLCNLTNQGAIRRVKKLDRGLVLWAIADCPAADEGPLATRSIPDVMQLVLQERGPLNPVELVVTLQEQGYKAEMKPHTLLRYLRQATFRNPDRFSILDDGRWQSV